MYTHGFFVHTILFYVFFGACLTRTHLYGCVVEYRSRNMCVLKIHLYVYVVMYKDPKHVCSYIYCQKSDMVSDKKSCRLSNSANTKSP